MWLSWKSDFGAGLLDLKSFYGIKEGAKPLSSAVTRRGFGVSGKNCNKHRGSAWAKFEDTRARLSAALLSVRIVAS